MWEHSVSCVLMLCQTEEKEKVKREGEREREGGLGGWEGEGGREGEGEGGVSIFSVSLLQEMCVQYWSEDKLKQHGDLFVELSQETSYPHYTMREFSLTNTKVTAQPPHS